MFNWLKRWWYGRHDRTERRAAQVLSRAEQARLDALNQYLEVMQLRK